MRNKGRILVAALSVLVIVFGYMSFNLYQDRVRMKGLVAISSEVQGEYYYVGRNMDSEANIERYIELNTLAFDTYEEQKEYYKKVFEIDETRLMHFTENYENYQAHIIRVTMANNSDTVIKDVTIHCSSEKALARNDVYYIAPVNISPEREFSNEIEILIDASGEDEDGVQEIISSLSMHYETVTPYGICKGRIRFCPAVN